MKDIYTSLNLIFVAFLIGPLFVIGVFMFLMQSGQLTMQDETLGPLLMYIGLGYIPLAIFLSNYLSKARLEKIPKDSSLLQKMEKYRETAILRMALIEGSTFLLIIAYLFSGNMMVLAGIGLLLAFQWLNRPTVEKISSDLSLFSEEQEELRKAVTT
ncbi:MAG: hypothetical protein AAF694_22415 [Bacteroidota bacterium]